MFKNKRFVILLILLLFQGIFTNIHHPLMPSYVKSLNLNDYMFGFFFAFMNLGMLFGAPFWGSVGDSGKKRLAVVLGFTIYGLFQGIFGFGTKLGPWTLSLVRFFSGFGISAAFSVLASEVILLTDKNNRAKTIALAAAVLAIGGAFGQFLGGQLYRGAFFIKYLKTDNILNVLLIQFASSIILAIYTLIFYKPVKTVKEENKRVSFLDGFKQIKKINADLIMFLIALTFITIAAVNVDKYLDVYFINVLGYQEDKLGLFKMIIGLIAVVVSVFIVPLFIKVKKRLLLISVFQAISSIIVFVLFYNTRFSFITYLYTIYVLYIIIKTINEPLEREYISSYSQDQNMSTIIGVRHSFYSLGTIIGPIFGAFLYDYKPKLVFYTSAVIFLIAIVLILISYLIRSKKFNKLNEAKEID